MATQNIDILINAKDNASKSLGRVSDIIKGIAAYDIAKNVAVGLFDIGKEAINLASNLEQTKVAFTTMTGSARVADAFIREMTSFAKTTPFEIGQVEQASKQLLAYGFAVQDVIPNLKMLGDVSAGVGMDKLPNLIMAFGQVSAATRLTGNELKQFTEAGVPLLEELATIMKKPVSEIQNLVSKGQVGFPLVQQAFKNLTSEGGRFENLMSKQSKTFGGMVSNFKDTITIILRDFGGNFLPGMKKILGDFLDFWDKNGKAIITSFIGMMNSIIDVSKFGFSTVAETFLIFAGFFVDTTKQSTENAFSSWQNFFFSVGMIFTDLKTAFLLVGGALVNTFYEATYGVGIAFVELGNAIIKILPKAIGAAVKFAAISLDLLINTLNKIPGIVQIPTIGGFVDDITNAVTATVNLDGVLTDLVKGRDKALKETSDKAKAIVKDANDTLKKNYLEMLKAQNNASASGETLAKVLEEIGAKSKQVIDGTKTGGGGKGSAGDSVKKQMEDLVKDTKSAMEGVFSTINNSLDSHKGKIIDLGGDYKKLGEELKKVGEDGAKALEEINKKLKTQSELIADTARGGREDVAKRIIEAEKELKELQDMSNKPGYEGRTKEQYAKMEALKQEIALGQQYAGQQAIDAARVESQKSETQLIIDKTAKKVEEQQSERIEIQKTYDLKKLEIEKETLRIKEQMDLKKSEAYKEFDLYKSLIVQRNKIETDYFMLFQKNIKEQMDKTKEAIVLMNTLASKQGVNIQSGTEARANGGPIISGRSYLVGENGPEMIIPRSNGTVIPNGAGNTVNINMGGITVNNQRDADYFVDKIKRELTREMQLFKLGIA